MICYTLSDCVIEGLITGGAKVDYVDFLMKFASTSSNCKLAIDKEGRAIDAYLSYEDPRIEVWVGEMGKLPLNWELIETDHMEPHLPIDPCRDIFREICCNTADKMLIVHSHNGWVRKLCTEKGSLEYNGVSLSVIDESEAKERIFPNHHTAVINNTYYLDSSVLIEGEASSGNIQIRSKK